MSSISSIIMTRASVQNALCRMTLGPRWLRIWTEYEIATEKKDIIYIAKLLALKRELYRVKEKPCPISIPNGFLDRSIERERSNT